MYKKINVNRNNRIKYKRGDSRKYGTQCRYWASTGTDIRIIFYGLGNRTSADRVTPDRTTPNRTTQTELPQTEPPQTEPPQTELPRQSSPDGTTTNGKSPNRSTADG